VSESPTFEDIGLTAGLADIEITDNDETGTAGIRIGNVLLDAVDVVFRLRGYHDNSITGTCYHNE
jgi:hypothetical protein